MRKLWIALVSVLLFSGAAMAADDWDGTFGTVDADGNGSISRVEWDEHGGKVKFDAGSQFAPTFKIMDADGSNSVSKSEWAGAAKTANSYSKACKASTSSWCPCQNHPELPECQ